VIFVRNSGEDLAANSERWVAPVLELHGFGQRECEPTDFLNGDPAMMGIRVPA
jgi:hypothetical protein